jgi:hypothetical protein
MAKFSQQFLANLGRPQMAESLFGLGSAIGSLPGQAKAKAKQEQFNKIMDLANRAMVTNDPVNLGRARRQLQELGFTEEANKLTAAQMQAEQKQTATGMFQDALGQPRGFTPEQKAAYIAKGATPEQVEAASKAGIETMDPIRERARGRLRAMAKNKNFDTGNVRMLDAYLAQAYKFFVSEDEAMKILSEERGTPFEREKLNATAGGRAGTTTFAGLKNYIDKRGLEYKLTEVRDPTGQGQVRIDYKPVGHETPYAFSYEDEEGNIVKNRLDALGGAYEETALARSARRKKEEKTEAEIDVTKAITIDKAENFNEQKTKAAERLPVVNQGLEKVNAMLQIVDGLETGSTLDQMMDLVQTALGYRETDRGVFEKLALQLVADNIKTYGSNPSDGERTAVQAMLPSLENTSAINREILEMARGRFAKERAAINYIQQEGMTLEKYVKFVDSLYPSGEDGVDPATGNKVVDINDIQ